MTQLSEIDAGCIGEQHERECHLGERVERVDLDVDLHQPPIGIGEEVADDDEHERPGDAVAAQQSGQRSPAEDEQCNDERSGLRHEPSSCSAAASGYVIHIGRLPSWSTATPTRRSNAEALVVVLKIVENDRVRQVLHRPSTSAKPSPAG